MQYFTYLSTAWLCAILRTIYLVQAVPFGQNKGRHTEKNHEHSIPSENIGNATKDMMEIYYINMKSSTARNIAMREHLGTLGHPFHRVEAVTIEGNERFNLKNAKLPCDKKTKPLIFNTTFLDKTRFQVNRLCVAPQNYIREIAVTLSHMKAIIIALASPNTNNYALIMEDDMTLAFDVDWDLLFETFPRHFGLIQLFTIQYLPIHMDELTREYTAEGRDFVKWEPKFYSATGYIVNKHVMRSHLTSLLRQKGETLEIDLIAGVGYQSEEEDNLDTCMPQYCCNSLKFIHKYPCVSTTIKDHEWITGINADGFIYSIAFNKTYTATLPFLVANQESAHSTIHANHSRDDAIRIDKLRAVVEDLYKGVIKLPPYLHLKSNFTI